MFQTTRGIILSYTRYGETSVISNIYTEEFGRQAYMINGLRSKKNNGKNIFLQALALVDLDVSYNPKKSIQRIKDFKVNTPFFQVPFEPVRRSLAFFIAEVLVKCLNEENKPHDNLFDFLHQSILVLDSDIEGIENYHLFFLLKFSQLLGFYPNFSNVTSSLFCYFDMSTGQFMQNKPSHNQYMNMWETGVLLDLNKLTIDNISELKLNRESRTVFLDKLLQYYQIHQHGFAKIKSLEILKTLFE